jgi:iron complex transport system substrate-binding protein
MTGKRQCLASGTVLLLLFGLLQSAMAEDPRSRPQRIVSMAPSTTEILFALGLGDRVVGVSSYCDCPAAAKQITKVGGLVDPNYEQIVALRPDLTVLVTSHRAAQVELEKLRIRTLTTPHQTIEDIHQAIRLIGAACGVKERADALLEGLASRATAVRRAVAGKRRRQVLICIGRDTGSGQLSGMYVAGRGGFYDEIIDLAGGVNAYQDKTVPYPQVSAESVLQMNPQVIVDLVSRVDPGRATPAEMKQHWRRLRPVSAVRDQQVHVLVGNHALRPGPRYIQFLEQMARLLHPDAFAQEDVDD